MIVSTIYQSAARLPVGNLRVLNRLQVADGTQVRLQFVAVPSLKKTLAAALLQTITPPEIRLQFVAAQIGRRSTALLSNDYEITMANWGLKF
jgi:hypothetical protein